MRSAPIAAPRRSSPANRSRTPSPALPPAADPPMPSCTSSPSRARSASLTVDDFDEISKRTPFICDLTPAGKYVASDYQAAGGSRLLAKRLIDAGHADGSTLTISGKTLAEEAALAKETPGQDVIHTFEKPIKPTGGLVILKGNLAPEGCVMKIAAANRSSIAARARLRLRRRLLRRRAIRHRSSPATCSSFATKAPRAVPACARCCKSPRPSLQRRTQRPRCPAHRRPLLRRNARLHRRPRRS
jgi:hypothetical protein